MRITPNDVNVNRNTIAAAAAIAGPQRGQRDLDGTCATRLAPSIRAASSWRGSRCAQRPPTVRTTTA